MRKFIVAALTVLCMGTAAFATEVYIVDVNKILMDSAPGKQAAAHVHEAQNILQKAMNDVVEIYKGKENQANAQQDIAQTRERLAVQLRNEDLSARNIVIEEMKKAVQTWIKNNSKGKKDNFIVVAKDSVIGASTTNNDITDKIIKNLSGVKAKFEPLPKVTIKQ